MEQGFLPTSFVAWLPSGKESFLNGLSASDAGRCGDRAGQRKSTSTAQFLISGSDSDHLCSF